MKLLCKILRFIASAALLFGFADCQKNFDAVRDGDGFPKESRTHADIVVAVKVPVQIETKSLADGSLSHSDSLIDGRVLDRLTLFLIDRQSDSVAAYRDISLTQPDAGGPSDAQTGADNPTGENRFIAGNTEAVFTFLYANPMHGDAERLCKGAYRIAAIANWGDIDDAGFADAIAAVKSTIGGGGRVAVNSPDFRKIYDATVSTGSDNLCPKNTMPLTLVKDTVFRAGRNTVSGQLMRTRARIRFVIKNSGRFCNITIANFKFHKPFTQTKTCLFDDPDNPDKKYQFSTASPAQIGTPDAGSADAIISFNDEVVLSGLQDTAVFEGYILESRLGLASPDSSNYQCSFDVKVHVGPYVCDFEDTVIADNPNNPYTIQENGMYAVERNGIYLVNENDGRNVVTSDTKMCRYSVDKKYIWRFGNITPAGTDWWHGGSGLDPYKYATFNDMESLMNISWWIKTSRDVTNKYDPVQLTGTLLSIGKAWLASDLENPNEKYTVIHYYETLGNNIRCISIQNDGTVEWLHSTPKDVTKTSEELRLYFHPVRQVTERIETINKIESLSDSGGNQIEEIKRNDFIQVNMEINLKQKK